MRDCDLLTVNIISDREKPVLTFWSPISSDTAIKILGPKPHDLKSQLDSPPAELTIRATAATQQPVCTGELSSCNITAAGFVSLVFSLELMVYIWCTTYYFYIQIELEIFHLENKIVGLSMSVSVFILPIKWNITQSGNSDFDRQFGCITT